MASWKSLSLYSKYMKVDGVIGGFMSLGQGTLLAKFDVESAYRNIPVHPEDCYLFDMKWQGIYFINMAHHFGLHSAPFIFLSVVYLLEWIFRHSYRLNFLLHYHGGFYTLGPPNSSVCQNNLDTCLPLFKAWHIPIQLHKLEGPSNCLTMLSIELDFLTLQARLSCDKFECIAALLESWSAIQHCTRKELKSLISTLHHVCKVIPQGRTFKWRMINLLSAF